MAEQLEELKRNPSALFWSGLAAGLSMGFSPSSIAGEAMGLGFGVAVLRGIFAGFSHIVAGSVDVLYFATTGAAGWGQVVGGYIAPALLGNILGGVSLVAAPNHAQVVS